MMAMEMDDELFSRSVSQDLVDVVTNWMTYRPQSPIPGHWSGLFTPLNAKTSIELQELSRSDCLKLVSRARKIMERFKLLADIFTMLGQAMHVEHYFARQKYEAVLNMSGLVVLPDELISRIFNHVVNDDTMGEFPVFWHPFVRQDVALLISHVSQLFRKTSLACPQLWKNITCCRKFSVECLTRSKNAPLDVQLLIESHENSGTVKLERFASEAMLRGDVWRKLKVHHQKICSDQMYTKESFPHLNLPLLDTIVFAGHDGRLLSSILEKWKLPLLRRAILYDTQFPLLPIFVNITSLELHFETDPPHASLFFEDLPRMKVLEDLKLTFCYLSIHDRTDSLDPVSNRTQLPSIRRLRLIIHLHMKRDCEVAGHLLSSVTFPGAVELDVTMNEKVPRYMTKFYGGEGSCAIDAMKSIFTRSEQFPRVENLKFHFFAESGTPMIRINIPLHLFPSTKVLALKCHVMLCHDYEPEVETAGDPSGSNQVSYPTLETVILDLNGLSKVLGRWIYELLERQKNQGSEKWDVFKELILTINKEGYEEGIYGFNREDALAEFLCYNTGDQTQSERGEEEDD